MPHNNGEITRRDFLRFSFAGPALIAAGNFISAARHVLAQGAASSGRPKKRIKGEHDLACAKGGDPYAMTVKAKFRYASPMDGWPILRDAIECDTFINIPVLKHHGLTKLTLSMKNLMGVCAGNRGMIHQGIARKIVDLTDFINPDLTVIDAFRFLYRNGPTGGNLADVKRLGSLIVATDPTLADAYAARLAGIDPLSVDNIKVAVQRKFWSADIDEADIVVLASRLT